MSLLLPRIVDNEYISTNRASWYWGLTDKGYIMKNIATEHTAQAQACLLRLMNAGYEFPDAEAYVTSRYVISADELRAFYDEHKEEAATVYKTTGRW